MTIFVTGDHHYGHKNILKYCNRPFQSLWEHDTTLIDAWNNVVGKKDVVYYLGDFSLGRTSFVIDIFDQLNGIIHLLYYPYHHDANWGRKKIEIVNMDKVLPIVVLEVPNIIIMCHYPFEIWDRKHYGSLHFHGHSHGMLPKISNRLDVGVDNAYKLLGEYRPFSLNEAIRFAKGEEND